MQLLSGEKLITSNNYWLRRLKCANRLSALTFQVYCSSLNLSSFKTKLNCQPNRDLNEQSLIRLAKFIEHLKDNVTTNVI